MLKDLLNLIFDNAKLRNNQPILEPVVEHLGANEDTRSDAEKQKDTHFGEIVASAAAVTWLKKTKYRSFPVFDQNGGSDCVANTAAKILGILRWLKDGNFVKFSPAHIYRRRSNFPGEGMIGNNAFEILAQGVTLDAIVPSDGLSEAQLNAIEIPTYGAEVAALFKTDNAQPILPPTGDIDTIASIIQQTGKPVMLWYFFTTREWGIFNGDTNGYNKPTVLDALTGTNDPRSLRHSVTAVDFTLTEAGEKALVIEDSAHFGGYTKRLVTENFHRARNWYAAYPMALKTVQVVSPDQAQKDPARPRYTFTKPLSFIPWNAQLNAPSDPGLNAAQQQDVLELQTILKYEGYFPSNVAATGYYGSITCKAVEAWQKAHNVDSIQVLTDLAGERFGAKSIAAMNAVYAV